MKVLLVNPPYPFEESPTPPFGLISLGAYLLDRGIDVRVEDFIVTPYSQERVRSVLAEYRPDVVGATGVTMNIMKALSIVKDYKNADPRITTVMGGPHVTFDADAILRDNPAVDCIVRGEGELTLMELLDAIAGGNPLSGIRGLSFREGGRAVHNEERPFIQDIDVLPRPARSLIPLSKYRALGFPINMITSRGCPHKCIFCVGSRMVGRRVRYFSVARVVDEFAELAKLGFNQINIVDDLFTSNAKRCISICNEIVRRGIVHPWTAFARVDTISAELLEHMKEAGCTMLCFGIESGNQEILDAVKKKTTLEKCRKAIALCLEAGIDPMSSYILGLPGETPETVEKTLAFAKSLNPNYGFHILAPFPGTEVRERKEFYGISILSDDWNRYDANQSVCETAFISHEKIDAIVGEYNSMIRRYIEDLGAKERAGEKMSDYDHMLVRNIGTFVFTSDLILKELVERYPGLANGAVADAVIKDFKTFVKGNTPYSEDEVNYCVGRLVDLHCIDARRSGTATRVAWT